jgi:hypothetical protein
VFSELVKKNEMHGVREKMDNGASVSCNFDFLRKSQELQIEIVAIAGKSEGMRKTMR